MNTSYGLDAYRSHDLNIAMKTSSGDLIKMDFANKQSSSMQQSQGENGTQTSMSFSSMQSFEFSIEGNGIDAQDQKEIDAFMQTAQPYIDDFLEEFSQDAPGTPVTKIAYEIASIFDPDRDRSEEETNSVKTNIVKMFDNAFNSFEAPQQTNYEEFMDKIFQETQNLLEQTLKEFDKFNQEIYA